ncbi:hypothetical protein L7F22_011106 [Adiantum nelumboides]|nr:hypothetical protein [Adiantum nelumboides]
MSASCSSAPATPIKKMVTLQCRDGELFEVELEVALLSQTIKNIVEDLDDCTSAPLPLPNVSSKELVLVLEFCHHQQHEHGRLPAPADGVEAAGSSQQISFSGKDEIEQWNAQFLLHLQLIPDVFDLILAASYLHIQSLVDLGCRRIANDIIDCNSPEEVRALLGIVNDFTPEEEAAIKRENQWAYTD